MALAARLFPIGLKPACGRAWVCLVFSIACAAVSTYGTAATINVAEASTGLAFSESEVGAYAVQLRQQFLAEAQAQFERGCASHCQKIAGVWERLLPVIQSQQPQALAKLRLEIVTSTHIDALSFAEGTIVLSEAFVTRLGLDDAQLGFVLAHEVAHILLQHERQTLTSAMALMAPRTMGSASDLYAEMQERYFSLDSYLAVIAHQTEFEADEVGLELAALAGFDPALQLAFMQKLVGADAGQSMVSTHPDAALRLQRLRALLPLAVRLHAVGTGVR